MSTVTDAFERRADERDAAPQFVLPLVVRIERDAPPARTDALETAARAVLMLLTDERSTGEGEWAEAVRDWQDGRIRKVVRRARGAEWRRAQALPGITVHGRDAEGACGAAGLVGAVRGAGEAVGCGRLSARGTHGDPRAVGAPGRCRTADGARRGLHRDRPGVGHGNRADRAAVTGRAIVGSRPRQPDKSRCDRSAFRLLL
jgi:hypothetical protein